MAILRAPKRQFKSPKVLEQTWDNFRKGLNTLFRDSELLDTQARQMKNLIVTGKGVVTQRPGTRELYQAGASVASTKVRGLYSSSLNDELLAVTDNGYLTKKNGTSHTVITGASWSSGYKVRMTRLGDQVYIVAPTRPLTKYDGTNLISYTTIASPSDLKATRISGTTGSFSYSWRVAAMTDVGRTLASDPVVLSNLPENLENTKVRLTWSFPSGASGLIKSWEMYGRDQGSESWLAGISPTTTTWEDDGSTSPSLTSSTPEFNETAGPNAKFITESVGKIVVANLHGKPNRFMWSGNGINQGRFSWTVGGGYMDCGDDEPITGIVEVEENNFLVFKKYSIYRLKLTYNSDLGIVEALLSKITNEVGCLSGDTIAPARNNYFFIGSRPGRGISLNSIGYEPNIASPELRTSEISEIITPDLEAINKARAEDMFAVVYMGIYWWFFPIGANEMRAYGYDLKRISFNGPHTFPGQPVMGTIYYDENGDARFVYGTGTGDSRVIEVSSSVGTDYNGAFAWRFASKKENFGKPFKLKTLLKTFVHLADVQGGDVNISVNIEDEEGLSNTDASISVEAPSKYAGFGSFLLGTKKFGSSDQASTSTTNTSDVRRFVDHNTPNVVSASVAISGSRAKAKILGVQLQAREQVSPSSSWMSDN
jgi:hypothetical protein